MKLIGVAVLVGASLFAAGASYGEMMNQMKDHTGGGTGASMQTEGKKADGQKDSAPVGPYTQEAEAASVTVKVTYKNPDMGKGPVFDVVLDTHSADLDGYDFVKIIVMRDDAGRVYNPALVSSKGTGHHREASLEFKDADTSAAKYIELVVKGVAGVEERVFKFEPSKEMKK